MSPNSFMKALLLSEYSHLEIADVPVPKPGEGEVLVKVEACGICGSDVHGYDGSSGRRIPPLIMGHEAAGVVSEVGPGIERLKVGDRITFDSTIYCGKCKYCQAGEVNLCDNRQILGVSTKEFRRQGAFAEYVTVPELVTYQLPKEVPAEHAAMIEPLAVAVHAVSLSKPEEARTALVVGAGMIGLLVVQALRVEGVQTIIVSDIDDTRLKLASELGATHTVNVKEKNLAEAISEVTGGAGVDLALEAVGNTPGVKSAIENVRKGGRVTLIGNVTPTVEIPLQLVVSRELTIQGSAASSGEYPRCIELLASGKVDVSKLITAVAPLEEGADWFQRLYNREPNLMKIVLTPTETAA